MPSTSTRIPWSNDNANGANPEPEVAQRAADVVFRWRWPFPAAPCARTISASSTAGHNYLVAVLPFDCWAILLPPLRGLQNQRYPRQKILGRMAVGRTFAEPYEPSTRWLRAAHKLSSACSPTFVYYICCPRVIRAAGAGPRNREGLRCNAKNLPHLRTCRAPARGGGHQRLSCSTASLLPFPAIRGEHVNDRQHAHGWRHDGDGQSPGTLCLALTIAAAGRSMHWPERQPRFELWAFRAGFGRYNRSCRGRRERLRSVGGLTLKNKGNSVTSLRRNTTVANPRVSLGSDGNKDTDIYI